MSRHISGGGVADLSGAALRKLRGSCRCGVLPAELGCRGVHVIRAAACSTNAGSGPFDVRESIVAGGASASRQVALARPVIRAHRGPPPPRHPRSSLRFADIEPAIVSVERWTRFRIGVGPKRSRSHCRRSGGSCAGDVEGGALAGLGGRGRASATCRDVDGSTAVNVPRCAQDLAPTLVAGTARGCHGLPGPRDQRGGARSGRTRAAPVAPPCFDPRSRSQVGPEM